MGLGRHRTRDRGDVARVGRPARRAFRGRLLVPAPRDVRRRRPLDGRRRRGHLLATAVAPALLRGTGPADALASPNRGGPPRRAARGGGAAGLSRAEDAMEWTLVRRGRQL